MAWAIAEKYPTVKSLMNAYENCHFEKEKLLAGIPYDHGTKKIPLTVWENSWRPCSLQRHPNKC